MAKNELVLKLIKKYQQNKAIIGSGHCKFYPTCSVYAYETFKKFNFFYASLLTIIRLIRCNPLAKRRYYPVKLTKKEKLEQKYLKTCDQYLNEPLTSFLMSLDQRDEVDNLFPYLYDYYYKPHFASSETAKIKMSNQMIISDEIISDVTKNIHTYYFQDLLKIAQELKAYGYLTKKLEESEIKPSTKYLYFVDDLKIEDLLKLNGIFEGVVLVNNYAGEINYLDFKVMEIKDDDFNEESIIHQNVIIKTNKVNIVKFLPHINFAINFYHTLDEIDYLYNINKRL